MRIISLVSGGLDSTVALALTREKYPHAEIIPINFYYGQRHSREIQACAEVLDYYNLPPARDIMLRAAFTVIGGSSLTSGKDEGNPSTEEVRRKEDGLPSTFVPGRNIIMLAIAGAIAHVQDASLIVGGWNVLDYSGYPDCRPMFIAAMQRTLNIGLGYREGHINAGEVDLLYIWAPIIEKTKAEIIAEGFRLQAPLNLTWSCYAGGLTPCGECDSCKIRAAGFEETGLKDPALV
jgi:7-cyano-7-deazaguanine synthase